MPIDLTKLPPVMHPTPKDILDFAMNLTISILTLAEAKGLFTRAEFGHILATDYDPEKATTGEHLTAMFASAMRGMKTPAEAAEEMRPHLRLVTEDEP